MRTNARKGAFKPRAFRRATKKGFRIHSDLKEFPVRSKKGFKYSICFVDDATRRGKTYAMRKKDEALEMLKRFIREECVPRDIHVCVLRSDNGGEYISEEFCMWCRTHHISREYSPPHGQSADGVSECFWREVARSVRAILWDQQRGDEWWPVALEFANETRNHLDSDAVDGSGVPEVEWTGGPVDVTHWRVPLSTSWSYIEKGNRDGGTLGDQRQQGVLVGYATDSKCYQVLPDDGDIVLNRRYEDVIVDETEHAPKNARRARSDLHTIIEETSEDAADDDDRDSLVHLGESSEEEVEIVEGERPAKKAKACVGGSSAETAATKATTTNESSEPLLETSAPGVKEFNGEGFFTVTKARSVRQLADLFACDPTEYLRLLRQYDGWYQQLKSIDSIVAPDSDVPVPQQAMESHKALRSKNKKKQQGGGEKNKIARKEPARETERSASGRSTAGMPRRSRRLEFLQQEAQKDAVAMLALAADFERQATAATKAPRVAPATPTRQEYNATAFFVADCGGDDDRDYGLAALTGRAVLDQWRETSASTPSPLVLYDDDEPHDRVYYEALAAGEISLLNLQGIEAPKSQKKAYSGPHRAAWMASEDREWKGLWKKGAFEDVAYTGQRLHHLLWIYKVKSSGLPKSRLCADGRQQDPSTYGDIASPTMRTTSFRILLAIAAMNHWGMWADDVTQAFLEAERPKDKPLWASYPSGYCVPPEEGGTGRSSSSGGSSGARRPSRCLLVKRQLYGLHDAPKGFFEELKKHLVDTQGFVQSQNDEALFVQYKPDSESEKARVKALEEAVAKGDKPYPAPVILGDIQVAVAVHVDDFASTGDDDSVAEYRRLLHERFPCTGGPIDEYHGLNVVVDRVKGETQLSCESYILRTLKKLGVTSWRPTHTPTDPELELPKLQGECKQKELQSRYRTVVGCVLHAAITARPDVAEAARALSSHLQHPSEVHLKAAMRVVYYLATTSKLALTYGRFKEESGFYGTCDASHGSEHGSKGVTGWAFHLAGGAVAWKARTQSLVALSSTEAELIAVDEAARELRYLEKVLADLGIKAPRPTPIGQDNLSACTLVGSTHFNPRSRHIALRYHSTGDLQRAGVLQVRYLPTEHIPSDALTKGLSRELHQRHTAVLLGLAKLDWT
jgi:hypothetical protein